tara:strand:+ start:148 stop:522 length:375 start_codon:yes stop_codon:yes gene_type:complete
MTSFLTLFQKLQFELGEVALPLYCDARLPRELILSQALHPDLSKDAATLIFKYNRCSNLLDPIGLYPTLDALGSLKAQTLQSNHADIDAIRFIEDMGRIVTHLLSDSDTESIDGIEKNLGKVEM